MISRSQMNRQLYNMGGEGIMQVASQQDSMPSDMQGEQYRPIAENLANDPKQAIEVIVKMLLEQGIPEEEARRIAMEMIQTIAQTGSLEEFEDDERVEARFGGRIGYADGGIGSLVNREQYKFGSIGKVFKSAAKAVTGVVKGAAKAVKSVAKSPIGRIALTVGATMALGPAGLNIGAGMSPFMGGALRAGLANLAVQAASGQKINLGEALVAGGIGGVTSGLTTPGTEAAKTAAENTTTLAELGLENPNYIADGYADLGAGAVGMTPTTGTFGQTTGFTLSNPELAGNAVVEGGSPMSIFGPSGRIETFAKELGQGNYLDALKQVSGAAIDNPITSIGLASLASSAAIPEEPKPEDFPSNEEYQKAVAEYQTRYAQYLQQNQSKLLPSTAKNPYYAANGGRIGYAFGDLVRSSGVVSAAMNAGDAPSSAPSGSGIGGLLSRLIRNNPSIFSVVKNTSSPLNTIQKLLARYYGNINPTLSSEEVEKYAREKAAYGGRMGYAYGSVDEGIMAAPQIAQQMGMPVGNPRQNQQGVAELDYRDQGGFVPPIGVKERADDIPAMLSNNEFVFTADAVKNAGGGDPNVGAQKMYTLMKKLESGGMV